MAYTTIDDPSAHFQVMTFAGDSSNSTVITNTGNSDLQPDLLWLRNTTLTGSGSASTMVYDTSRGITSGQDNPYLQTNSTGTESTNSNGVKAVSSDGFTPGSMTRTNETNSNFVCYQWKANGGTTSSNTDGDITTTVQVNSTAGFSIITDSPGNNTARNIGHGLGSKPGFIIRRARNRGENWNVAPWAKQPTLPGGYWGFGTEAYNDTGTTGYTAVANTTFGVSTDYSVNGNYNYVTYCWKPIKGFSKFGNYWGNSSATDGPFVYCGFQPAYIIIKRVASSSYSGWMTFDSVRRGNGNIGLADHVTSLHRADNPGDRGEGSDIGSGNTCVIDILSSGFKIRDGGSDEINDPSDEYTFAAWAEHPYVTSDDAGSIPTTAR